MNANGLPRPGDRHSFVGGELEATNNDVVRLDNGHDKDSQYFRLIILSDGGFDATLIRRIFEERFQSPAISVEIGVRPYQLPETLRFIEGDQPDVIVLAIADLLLKKNARDFLEEETWQGMVIDIESLGISPADRDSSVNLNQLIKTMDENLDRAWAELLGEVKISRDALVKASSALSQSETVQQRVEALSRDVSRIDDSISDLRNADTQILLRDTPENPIAALFQNKVTAVLTVLASFAVYVFSVASLYWVGVLNPAQTQKALLYPIEVLGLVSEDSDAN